MKAEEKKSLFLSSLFQHLDGIPLIPTIIALEEKQILSKFQDCNLYDLSAKHNANAAYLNVALRLLCSQGILIQHINHNNEVFFTKSKHFLDLKNIIQNYKIVYPLYVHEIDYSIILKESNTNTVLNSVLFKTIKSYIQSVDRIESSLNIKNHIEGAVLSPIIVTLSRAGVLKNIKNKKKKWWIKLNRNWQNIIKELFTYTQITDKTGHITEYGYFILKRATSYGVTVSYLPTFRNINNLLFGNHTILFSPPGEVEKHVDRGMNVWGSGGAHNTYFKRVDEIILDLFNLPIEKQPKGFIDIGCGNGKFIEHIFDLIYYKTKRGKKLEQHPLFIVGSDFNYKALEATKETINQADIWAKTAFGDISDPESLAERLKEKHQINLEDLLNVRSFLDHNRMYTPPIKKVQKKSDSTGTFCYKGEIVKNDELQQNLTEHFEKWHPYLKKYGLLIVELHTINPKISAQNIGKTAITAYDASHGFSDQYIIEYNLFLECAFNAGLKPDPKHEYIFPSEDIPIVSINRLINSTDS